MSDQKESLSSQETAQEGTIKENNSAETRVEEASKEESGQQKVVDKDDQVSQQEMWMRIHRQTKQINAQLEQLNNHKLVHTYNSLPRFIWFSLVKGIAVGLGSVLGATVVLSFLVYVLSQMEFIPILGEWITAILEVVKKPETN